MTDKEKQIEEMAKVIIKAGESYYKMPVDIECAGREASELYEAGYLKQSDTAREILQKLIYNITTNNTIDGYLSESIDYSSTIDDIKELAAEYGVKKEDLCD